MKRAASAAGSMRRQKDAMSPQAQAELDRSRVQAQEEWERQESIRVQNAEVEARRRRELMFSQDAHKVQVEAAVKTQVDRFQKLQRDVQKTDDRLSLLYPNPSPISRVDSASRSFRTIRPQTAASSINKAQSMDKAVVENVMHRRDLRNRVPPEMASLPVHKQELFLSMIREDELSKTAYDLLISKSNVHGILHARNKTEKLQVEVDLRKSLATQHSMVEAEMGLEMARLNELEEIERTIEANEGVVDTTVHKLENAIDKVQVVGTGFNAAVLDLHKIVAECTAPPNAVSMAVNTDLTVGVEETLEQVLAPPPPPPPPEPSARSVVESEKEGKGVKGRKGASPEKKKKLSKKGKKGEESGAAAKPTADVTGVVSDSATASEGEARVTPRKPATTAAPTTARTSPSSPLMPMTTPPRPPLGTSPSRSPMSMELFSKPKQVIEVARLEQQKGMTWLASTDPGLDRMYQMATDAKNAAMERKEADHGVHMVRQLLLMKDDMLARSLAHRAAVETKLRRFAALVKEDLLRKCIELDTLKHECLGGGTNAALGFSENDGFYIPPVPQVSTDEPSRAVVGGGASLGLPSGNLGPLSARGSAVSPRGGDVTPLQPQKSFTGSPALSSSAPRPGSAPPPLPPSVAQLLARLKGEMSAVHEAEQIELLAAKREILELKEQYQALCAQLGQTEKERDALRTDKEFLENRVEQLTEAMRVREHAMLSVDQRVREAQDKVDAKQEELNEAVKKVAELEDERHHMLTKMQDMVDRKYMQAMLFEQEQKQREAGRVVATEMRILKATVEEQRAQLEMAGLEKEEVINQYTDLTNFQRDADIAAPSTRTLAADAMQKLLENFTQEVDALAKLRESITSEPDNSLRMCIFKLTGDRLTKLGDVLDNSQYLLTDVRKIDALEPLMTQYHKECKRVYRTPKSRHNLADELKDQVEALQKDKADLVQTIDSVSEELNKANEKFQQFQQFVIHFVKEAKEGLGIADTLASEVSLQPSMDFITAKDNLDDTMYEPAQALSDFIVTLKRNMVNFRRMKGLEFQHFGEMLRMCQKVILDPFKIEETPLFKAIGSMKSMADSLFLDLFPKMRDLLMPHFESEDREQIQKLEDQYMKSTKQYSAHALTRVSKMLWFQARHTRVQKSADFLRVAALTSPSPGTTTGIDVANAKLLKQQIECHNTMEQHFLKTYQFIVDRFNLVDRLIFICLTNTWKLNMHEKRMSVAVAKAEAALKQKAEEEGSDEDGGRRRQKSLVLIDEEVQTEESRLEDEADSVLSDVDSPVSPEEENDPKVGPLKLFPSEKAEPDTPPKTSRSKASLATARGRRGSGSINLSKPPAKTPRSVAPLPLKSARGSPSVADSRASPRTGTKDLTPPPQTARRTARRVSIRADSPGAGGVSSEYSATTGRKIPPPPPLPEPLYQPQARISPRGKASRAPKRHASIQTEDIPGLPPWNELERLRSMDFAMQCDMGSDDEQRAVKKDTGIDPIDMDELVRATSAASTVATLLAASSSPRSPHHHQPPAEPKSGKTSDEPHSPKTQRSKPHSAGSSRSRPRSAASRGGLSSGSGGSRPSSADKNPPARTVSTGGDDFAAWQQHSEAPTESRLPDSTEVDSTNQRCESWLDSSEKEPETAVPARAESLVHTDTLLSIPELPPTASASVETGSPQLSPASSMHHSPKGSTARRSSSPKHSDQSAAHSRKPSINRSPPGSKAKLVSKGGVTSRPGSAKPSSRPSSAGTKPPLPSSSPENSTISREVTLDTGDLTGSVIIDESETVETAIETETVDTPDNEEHAVSYEPASLSVIVGVEPAQTTATTAFVEAKPQPLMFEEVPFHDFARSVTHDVNAFLEIPPSDTQLTSSSSTTETPPPKDHVLLPSATAPLLSVVQSTIVPLSHRAASLPQIDAPSAREEGGEQTPSDITPAPSYLVPTILPTTSSVLSGVASFVTPAPSSVGPAPQKRPSVVEPLASSTPRRLSAVRPSPRGGRKVSLNVTPQTAPETPVPSSRPSQKPVSAREPARSALKSVPILTDSATAIPAGFVPTAQVTSFFNNWTQTDEVDPFDMSEAPTVHQITLVALRKEMRHVLGTLMQNLGGQDPYNFMHVYENRVQDVSRFICHESKNDPSVGSVAGPSSLPKVTAQKARLAQTPTVAPSARGSEPAPKQLDAKPTPEHSVTRAHNGRPISPNREIFSIPVVNFGAPLPVETVAIDPLYTLFVQELQKFRAQEALLNAVAGEPTPTPADGSAALPGPTPTPTAHRIHPILKHQKPNNNTTSITSPKASATDEGGPAGGSSDDEAARLVTPIPHRASRPVTPNDLRFGMRPPSGSGAKSPAAAPSPTQPSPSPERERTPSPTLPPQNMTAPTIRVQSVTVGPSEIDIGRQATGEEKEGSVTLPVLGEGSFTLSGGADKEKGKR